jgi:ribosomal protein S12 methylthiotransferase accessory factor
VRVHPARLGGAWLIARALAPVVHSSLDDMDLTVTLPGNGRVDVAFGDFVIHTDRSREHGGAESAPQPFDTFLAAIGACAGAYVFAYCEARGIPSDGIRLHERCTFGENHRLERVEIEIALPPGFPDKYRAGVRIAAESCKIKKTLTSPPTFEVTTTATQAPAALQEEAP